MCRHRELRRHPQNALPSSTGDNYKYIRIFLLKSSIYSFLANTRKAQRETQAREKAPLAAAPLRRERASASIQARCARSQRPAAASLRQANPGESALSGHVNADTCHASRDQIAIARASAASAGFGMESSPKMPGHIPSRRLIKAMLPSHHLHLRGVWKNTGTRMPYTKSARPKHAAVFNHRVHLLLRKDKAQSPGIRLIGIQPVGSALENQSGNTPVQGLRQDRARQHPFTKVRLTVGGRPSSMEAAAGRARSTPMMPGFPALLSGGEVRFSCYHDARRG